MDQLISYIAPAAPATRRPAQGHEPFLRPEVGFTPKWYRQALGIDFGDRYHRDPEYRRTCVIEMRAELSRRFPGTPLDREGIPLDLLTGTYGACTVAAIYGILMHFYADNWPVSAHEYLSDEAADALDPPDLDSNPFFAELMGQVETIATLEGQVEGYINWQGVLNNAHRLRGEALFTDLLCEPDRIRRLFDCVCTTMVDAAKRLHERQRTSGHAVDFFTMSNCLVNMVSGDQYRDLLLPYDQRIAADFARVGIHNCAWNADPYLDHYAAVPKVAYIDMGFESDLAKARSLFPNARRALMYPPTDLSNRPIDTVRADLEHIARDYGPCDVVAADIEAGTPDERVHALFTICDELSSDL